jgi:uncharacterized membrane protein
MVSEALAPTEANARRRWLAGGLFVSIVLNLFLAGLIIGQVLRPGFWEPANPYAADLGLPAAHIVLRMTHELDRADRRVFADAMKAHSADLVPLGDQLRRQRQEVLKLLRAEPLDRAAVDKAFAELQQRTRAFEAAFENAAVEAAAKLPPDARQYLGRDHD